MEQAKQEDTGESNSNEKTITFAQIATIPVPLKANIINKPDVESHEIKNKLQPKMCISEHETKSHPRVFQKPYYYLNRVFSNLDEAVLSGVPLHATDEVVLNKDVIEKTKLEDTKEINSNEKTITYTQVTNIPVPSHRDAHVFNPALNVVVIPEIDVNVGTTSESSTSEASTSQSDKDPKTHYENPDKDCGLSELKLYLRSMSFNQFKETTLKASTSQAYRKRSRSESGVFEPEHSDSELSESELSESEISDVVFKFRHYNIEKKLVEDDTESGTAPNNTNDPPSLREDSAVSNGTSESPPQPNYREIQNNGRKFMNTRPLPLEADTYELEKFSKNAMLIFNQEDVEDFPELRIGTEDDVNALKKSFGNFGFEAEEYKDKTVAEVFDILSEFSKRDFTDYGCIAIAILTHGTRYGLLRAKNANETYSERSVLDYLNVSKNPTLLTKPIIVIIQACRGNDEATGYRTNTDLNVSRDNDSPTEHYYLPLHSDTLVLHSSFYGKPAFRPDKGSWFIQTLCEKINLLSPKLDLASIITEVQKHVAIKKNFVEYSFRTKEMEVNKQMPVMTSTLIRKLYLMTGDDEKWQTTSNQRQQTYDTVDTACINAMEHECIDTKVHCSCFIGHFNYLKNCLSHFVDENPTDRKDSQALYLLQEANKIDKNYDSTEAQTTLIAISNFLQNNSRNLNYHKYLYFYSNINNHSDSRRNLWRRLCQNFVPIGAACIISSLALRKMIK